MNRTLEEWIEFYNRKAPRKFERDERAALFYLPDKGFCELKVLETIVLVGQACGDGRYWKKLAEEVARKFDRKACGTVCLRREIKAWIRRFGYTAYEIENKGGLKRYHCKNKDGNWYLMTEYVCEDGRHEHWTTWEVGAGD